MPNLWVVRAGSKGERESWCLENQVVVTWGHEIPSMAGMTPEGIRDALAEHYAGRSPQAVTKWAKYLYTFAHRIEEGDIVAMPRKGTQQVALGVARGPYSCLQINTDVWLHSRRVEWRRTEVPKVDLDGVNTKDRRWIYQSYGEGIAERLTSLMNGSGRWPL